VPFWQKVFPPKPPINAKSETVSIKPTFRQAFQRRRCLIPADGFYEWREIVGENKQPMFIHLEGDGGFAFAGIWERWRDPQTNTAVDTAAIITTTPNELMKSIHDRMPVILDPGDYARWLGRETPADDVAAMLRPYPAERMTAHPVSTRVNKPANDGPDLIVAA
jgi:putative SOS response-associated peptidase YedK